MEAKIKKPKKKFDAIKVMREIRDKMSLEIMTMTYEEERAFLDKLLSKDEMANSTYMLTDEKYLAIEESQKQFKNGQFLKSDKADKEIDELLGR
jgi:hypothetical protein